MAKSRVLYALLSFVMMGMTLGAILQFALFRRLEDPNAGGFSWENDADARILRLGLVKQEVISWSPRIILFRNFLSPEECDYLIAIARPRLGKSTVVDVTTGKGVESKVRTSTSMFLTSDERKYPMIELMASTLHRIHYGLTCFFSKLRDLHSIHSHYACHHPKYQKYMCGEPNTNIPVASALRIWILYGHFWF